MANDVTSKVILGLDPSEFRRGIQQVDAKLKQTTKLFGNLGQVIGASFAVAAIQDFTAEAIRLGSEMQTVSQGFARFGDEQQLNSLRTATRGLVSDLELMKVAVQAGNFGIPIEQMANLLAFATRRAAETGQSVDYLVQSIVTGIGRKSPLILDNLGISVTRLKEKFNGAALEAQSIADVSRAVGDIAAEELGKMGGAIDTAADKMQRLSTSWTNFKTKVGEAIAPAAGGVLEGLTNMLEGLGTMGQGLNQLGVATGTAKPSDLVKTKNPVQAQAQVTAEVQRTIVSLESMRAALKELETEYNTTEVGTKRFYELRRAIEQANYELGRATGETWNGAKQSLIELNTKGMAPFAVSSLKAGEVLRASTIPSLAATGTEAEKVLTALENYNAQVAIGAAIGAQFGMIITGAFNSAMDNGTNFFQEIGIAIQNYVQQLIVAVATTAALAAVISGLSGGSIGFGAAFRGVSAGTGLGGLFGEGGVVDLSAQINGYGLTATTNRMNRVNRLNG